SDALNHTHVDAKSLKPAESEYCSANVWLAPLPVEGVTESLVTVTVPATVHAPLVCHPLAVPYAFAPNMRIDLPPANGVLKTTARFNVIVVPVPVTVVGPSWMMH